MLAFPVIVAIFSPLKKRVVVDAMSPVVMNISAQMNTPELAKAAKRNDFEHCEPSDARTSSTTLRAERTRRREPRQRLGQAAGCA